MRRTLVRWTYALMLVSMLAWITTSIVGGFVYKSADGLVVGDAGMISPEYTVTVLEVLVHNGDKVRKGDLVARVSSSRVAAITATLSLQSSQLVSRMAEITSKAGIIDQLVDSAETREHIVGVNNEMLQLSNRKGYLPALTANAVADQVFRGKQELALLRSEKETMSAQVAQIVAASRFTDQALLDIQMLFDAGRMRAPMDGFISSIETGIGAVVQPGSLVAEMVGEHRYIVAYVPVNRLYELHDGAPVTIEVGVGRWLHGSISRIEPIAGRLPKEFQKTLSPVERQQLVRVEFDEGTVPPPYFTKVTVR
jgi:HlyD family secretion protein